MLTLLLIGTLILVFGIQPAKAAPITIIVPDDYPMIQQAVDAASNGDTILVRAGTYTGDVVISDKSISLVGQGAANTTVRGLGKDG
jgi:pectin methylesterase-like acyl-CoA thioesterase